MAVKNRNTMRARHHLRIRKKVSGTTERPRFCVSITANHIYCQFIDDVKGETRGGGGQGRERHGSRF